MRTKSACVVLALGILLILVAVGMKGSLRPAQANIRIASSTTQVSLTSTLQVATASVTAGNPHPLPARTAAPAAAGLRQWLKTVLLAAGLPIGTALLAAPALVLSRRRRRAAGKRSRIVLADYERLVVTHSKRDDTVYVLRPPGADPTTILLAARLVLREDPYEQLADHLGVPASWPMG